MLRSNLLTFFIIIITIVIILTINSFSLPPQVESTSESLSPSSDENNDGNGGDNGNEDGDDSSGPQDTSPQGDSTGSGSSSDGNGDENGDGNDGIGPTDDQNLVGDDGDDVADQEPPTSTERGGNPLEGLNLRKAQEKADCEKYLKSLGGGGGDETSVGDTILDPFETKEEYCKRILGAGIDVHNITTIDGPANIGLLNSDGNNNGDATGQSIVNCAPDTGIVIKEEGMPSKTTRPQPDPQPQPPPNPPPQQPAPGGC